MKRKPQLEMRAATLRHYGKVYSDIMSENDHDARAFDIYREISNGYNRAADAAEKHDKKRMKS